MKRLILSVLVAMSPMTAWAGNVSGSPDNTSATAKGSYFEVRSIAGSSTTGSEFWPASTKRLDSVCQNYSTQAIWVGTTTATQNNRTHANISLGYFLSSSGTVRIEGVNTGTISFTCEIGQANCTVRCLDQLIP